MPADRPVTAPELVELVAKAMHNAADVANTFDEDRDEWIREARAWLGNYPTIVASIVARARAEALRDAVNDCNDIQLQYDLHDPETTGARLCAERIERRIKRVAIRDLHREYLERTPAGSKLCYWDATNRTVVVIGFPDDDPEHNCDAMGCGTFSHVLERVNVDQAEARATKALDACRLALAYVERHDRKPYCDAPLTLADEADAVEDACRAALSGEGGRR